MFIENPNRKFKLAHLLEMNKSNLYNFQYEDLYNVVEEWLESEKEYFFNKNFFRKFIESFCDRFFRRDFNFDTFLDFKLALRDVFRKYKDNADRIYQSSLLELNPLYTAYIENESTTENNGESDTHGDSNNKTDDSSEVEDKNYNLYSDTPQSSLNLDDLLSVNSNYITNLTNNLNKHTDKHKSENNNTYNDNNFFKNNTDFKGLQKGYNGQVADLLNNYIELNLDVIKHYLDWIEDECLFSSVLY